MAGPIIALQFLLMAAFIAGLLIIIYTIIKKRRSLMVSIPLSVLLIALLVFVINTYWDYKKGQKEASKNFLGDYRLTRLDREDCRNCTVRLNGNYQYDIIVDNEIVGHGKWSIGSAVDIPGLFLQLENAPHCVIWEKDRVIPAIDRTGE